MKWNLLDTGFNRGRFNMDFDIELVQRKLMDQAFLRFYRWKPYCISLGFNQLLESIDSERAKKDNIDIVRRPTGGRAILHAEELTYSVVYPVNGSYSPKTLYHEINIALKMGLEIYHPSLQKLELEHKLTLELKLLCKSLLRFYQLLLNFLLQIHMRGYLSLF